MKKLFSTLGMIVSVLIIIVGVLTLTGTFGYAHYSGNTTTYDSGFGVFGADYYTYSVNNSAAASAARAAAYNLTEISNLLSSSLGLFITCFGLISFCAFGIVHSDCSKKKKARKKEAYHVKAVETQKGGTIDSTHNGLNDMPTTAKNDPYTFTDNTISLE